MGIILKIDKREFGNIDIVRCRSRKVVVWRRTINEDMDEITVMEEYNDVRSVSETEDGFRIVLENKEQIWVSKDYLEKVVIRR